MPSSSKFQELHPRNSLRKLRTAFSSAPPSTTAPPAQSSTSISSTSPLSAHTAGSRFSTFSFSNMSNLSLGSAFNSGRIIRRKKSMFEVEQEEERTQVGDSLISLVEPRPSMGPACGSIEEILDGRV